MKIKIPRIPTPFPDELLGSWLARVAKANEVSVWISLVTECGFSKGYWSRTDVGPADERFDRLLEALGSSYANELILRTTLPFWLCFDGSPASDEAVLTPGPPRVLLPMVELRGKAHAASRNRPVHSQGSQRGALGLKYCPQCLRDDKIPFWHRSHQLPVCMVCHIHACELLVCCPKCGASQAPTTRQYLLQPPKLQCRCGIDLSQREPYSGANAPALHHLSKLAVDAMNNGLPDWDYRGVRAAAKRLLDATYYETHGIFSDTLQRDLGFRSENGERLVLSLGLPETVQRSLVIHPTLALAAAPALCCLFAALGLEFEELKRELSVAATVPAQEHMKHSQAVSVKPGLQSEEALLAQAKERLTRNYLSRKSPSYLALLKAAFWRVRLLDPEWLENLVGKGKLPRANIPSSAADRKILTQLAAKHTSSSASVLSRVVRSPAGQRAAIRDSKWFSNLRKSLIERKRRASAIQANALVNDVLKRVQQAIALLLTAQDRPAKIGTSEVAWAAGLTTIQLDRLVRKHESLRDALNDANKDWKTRRLRWYLAKLKDAGSRQTISQILHNVHFKRADTPLLRALVLREESLRDCIRQSGSRPSV